MIKSILSPKGRMRRRDYVLITIPLGIINTFLIYILEDTYDIPTLLLLFILLLAFTVIEILQIIKRLHDVNLSGTYWLVGLIPIINIGFGFWLVFKPGTKGPNKYGDDPKKRN